jgi:S1-C subfamily serine protease
VKKLLISALLACSSLLLPACTTVVEKTVVQQQVDARFDALRNATVMLEMKDESGKVTGSCSGVFISAHVLLTAAHCDSEKLGIHGEGDAVKIRKDETKDLMLVFVEKNTKHVPIRRIANDAEIDAKVVTVGYPLGMVQAVTEGRVQGGVILDGIPPEILERVSGYIVITSPIIFGNSGGPVFIETNEGYKLVGIVSALRVVGFGTPITHLGLAVGPDAILKFLNGI